MFSRVSIQRIVFINVFLFCFASSAMHTKEENITPQKKLTLKEKLTLKKIENKSLRDFDPIGKNEFKSLEGEIVIWRKGDPESFYTVKLGKETEEGAMRYKVYFEGYSAGFVCEANQLYKYKAT